MQMSHSTALIRLFIVGWVLGLTVLVAGGCHKSDTATPITTAGAGNLQNAGGKKPQNGSGGGGVPDMNDYPAPAGQKTGVLPGGQK